MCYDIKTKLESQVKRAAHYLDNERIDELSKQLSVFIDYPIYHTNAFTHPTLAIYTSRHPHIPVPAVWGLIPFWVKNTEQAYQIWNKTLNARGETIFEKASFKAAAKYRRCIIPIDGFYEHHHYKGKKYPFYIQAKNHELIYLGGLFDEWTDKETGEMVTTFTIVTTPGVGIVADIHNNPKLNGARMPLIFNNETQINTWLESDKLNEVKALIKLNNTIELHAYPVKPLRGKHALGNVPEVFKKQEYPELQLGFGSNFK